MQNKQQLTSELESMATFRMISQAYEEIAVMRMQRIRGTVLKMRLFLEELRLIFQEVRGNYVRQLALLSRKHLLTQSILEKNGKSSVVFLSAGSKLNGDIISKVFREFLAFTREHPDWEIVIVGKTGRQLYDQQQNVRKYVFFEFDENHINNASLQPLFAALISYKEITVFHGKFESLLTQQVMKNDLTGSQLISDEKFKTQNTYMYEPPVETVLRFFETQIFSSLVLQSVNESELSRYASRIHSMEEAMGNIDKSTKQLKSQWTKMRKIVGNRKQLETMSKVVIS
jgi:ATP synthase F1 gamma subunit